MYPDLQCFFFFERILSPLLFLQNISLCCELLLSGRAFEHSASLCFCFLFFCSHLFFYFWREGLITAEHRTVRSWRVFDFCCSLFVCFFCLFSEAVSVSFFFLFFFILLFESLSRFPVDFLLNNWWSYWIRSTLQFSFFFSFLTTYLFFWIWFVDIFSFLFLDFCFQPRFFWSFY